MQMRPRQTCFRFGQIATCVAAMVLIVVGVFLIRPVSATTFCDDELSKDDFKLIEAVEQHRVKAIQQVIGSVIAIYDNDRKGGGSGVIIDPSGIALTNHHVIMGAGVAGWGGLADGKMYKWKLIGTDPGGDVSIIQMERDGDFPFTPLGNSDDVRVGDWALAMGNPFILTEDQAPTVTLGIVSGVKRYQPGAGLNQLVYGNCIQVDSSINPGNSGGPLFNLNGEVIGINGRGSFKERGRVNVGLGYAISSNQIKNFIPELLATKLVEHATLDASFSDRKGKVVCSQLNLDAPVAVAGLQLGDELLEFEGLKVKNANQYTNLICTLPEDWPTELKIRKADGSEKTIVIRTFGLPYRKPKPPKAKPGGEKPNPEQEKKLKRQRQMVELLAAPPGEVRHKDVNRKYVQHIVNRWRALDGPKEKTESIGVAKLVDRIVDDGNVVGSQTMWLATDGRCRIELKLKGQTEVYIFDGKSFHVTKDDQTKELSLVEAKLNLTLVQALAMMAVIQEKPFGVFGETLLDGSDKALGQNAYRFKLLDDDEDHFYFWVRMFGYDGRPSARLLKASAHKDCDDTGGVSFFDWRPLGPVVLPHRREFLSGLTETPNLVVVNESSKWLEKVDESWFIAHKADEDKVDQEKAEASEISPVDATGADAGEEGGVDASDAGKECP